MPSEEQQHAQYRNAGIPQRFWPVTFSDYETDEQPVLAEALTAVMDYVTGIEDHLRTGRGLLLVGEPGYGKTMLAAMVLKAALAKGSSGFYVTYAGYVRYLLNMMELRAAWDKYDDIDSFTDWQRLSERVKAMRNRLDFVVLDDVGKEHTTNTQYAEDELDFILRRRYDLALPTILTSNVPIERWATNYSASMKSFVAEAFEIVPLGGIQGYDYRRKASVGRR